MKKRKEQVKIFVDDKKKNDRLDTQKQKKLDIRKKVI